MRVGLIACSKEKLAKPAIAQDLYTGPIFQLSKAWMLKRLDNKHGPVNEWGILSAKYGLVLPNKKIGPYDQALGDLPKEMRDRWAQMVNTQLMQQWGEGVIYMVLAGADYRSCLRGMPMVEDVIDSWSRARKDNGMTGRRAVMGIGLIKRNLKHNVPFAGLYRPEKK